MTLNQPIPTQTIDYHLNFFIIYLNYILFINVFIYNEILGYHRNLPWAGHKERIAATRHPYTLKCNKVVGPGSSFNHTVKP